MTCGIDGDDDKYSCYGRVSIPLNISGNNAEKLQGRDIKKLETSHSLFSIIEIIVSEFNNHKSTCLTHFIPYSRNSPPLKGRHIQQLNASDILLQGDISILIISKENPNADFYKKRVLDLTFEMSESEDEEQCESDWKLSPTQRFIESNVHRDGLTMEELLSQNGMVFDFQRGQYTECRSWLKKVGHSIEKNVRKGAKKTCKFVKEHKTEILIAAGALIAGGCVAAEVYYLISAELAQDAAVATIVAATTPFRDPPRKRRPEKDILSSSGGTNPDPERDPVFSIPQSPMYIPPLRIPQNATGKQVFNLLSKPISISNSRSDLHLRNSILKVSALLPAEQPILIMPPQGNIEATTKQLFDKLFMPSSHDSHVSIYQRDVINRHKIEKAAQAIPLQAAPQKLNSTRSFLNSAHSFKNAFGTYLENRQGVSIDSEYPMYAQRLIAEIDSILPTPKTCDVDATSKWEILKSGVEAIANNFIKSDFTPYSTCGMPKETASTIDPKILESTVMRLFGIWDGEESSPSDTNRLVNPVFNSAAYLPARNPEKSCYFKTEGTKRSGMGIGFIPGMNTSFQEAEKHLYHIKKFLGDFDMYIEGVYNHSHTMVGDLAEIFTLNYNGIAPNTARLLIENWTRFHEENIDNLDAKYLQFAHSMGSIITHAALQQASEEIRQRVIAVTVGTAKVIPDRLCFQSRAYASELDLIHYGEDFHTYLLAACVPEEERLQLLDNLHKAHEKLVLLRPREDVRDMDHGFQSSTNDLVFNKIITSYLVNKGEYKQAQ